MTNKKLSPGIELNKLRYTPRGIKVTEQSVDAAVKARKRRDARLEKARKRQIQKEDEARLMQYTLESAHIKKLFPDSVPSHIIVRGLPEEMKEKFEAFCRNRGFTTAGRLRKFILDCITGAIKE